jgi:hypothetical protein
MVFAVGQVRRNPGGSVLLTGLPNAGVSDGAGAGHIIPALLLRQLLQVPLPEIRRYVQAAIRLRLQILFLVQRIEGHITGNEVLMEVHGQILHLQQTVVFMMKEY